MNPHGSIKTYQSKNTQNIQNNINNLNTRNYKNPTKNRWTILPLNSSAMIHRKSHPSAIMEGRVTRVSLWV